ncbi:hypothetical protein M404DRAFT_374373 [Pisolithus tinctorius Marx 270]|uniref:Uncharacterized protein n=1 Tax=Pisolithus tinctorius Marx 270 TaxID=870435 RepID=A0A0C3NGJ7_PISTI|nr:hypothetical protein M404DRAFT_374373 [Pisolithus tinctorius Marx 270]
MSYLLKCREIMCSALIAITQYPPQTTKKGDDNDSRLIMPFPKADRGAQYDRLIDVAIGDIQASNMYRKDPGRPFG